MIAFEGKTMKRMLVAALVAAGFAAPTAASAESDAWRRWADAFSREMRASMGTLFAGRMGPGKVVEGAPYSAEVVTETNQALADGNVISRRTSGAIYRDGEGRTRQETAAEGKERTVFINDPVAGKHYVLSPGARRAVVAKSPGARVMTFTDKQKQVVRLDGTEVRVEDGKVFIDGTEMTGRVEHTVRSGRRIVVEDGRVTIDGREIGMGGHGGSNVVVNSLQSSDGARREEVRVHVIRGVGDPVPPMPPIPPMPPGAELVPPPMPPLPGVQTMRFETTARLGKGVTTRLGSKDFDGVKAEGRATVWTIPAGEIGNRDPIQVTSERWYSPELQVAVLSRHSDPRTGESVYRLADIRRGEPPAELFRVPEDVEATRRPGRR